MKYLMEYLKSFLKQSLDCKIMSYKRLSFFSRLMSQLLILLMAIAFISGCASSEMKARKAEREKAIQSGKMYCDFVNGDVFKDIEVAVNVQMAKNCDSSKSFSLTNYKLASENNGILFCCAPFEKEKKETSSSKEPAKETHPKEAAKESQ